MKRAEELFFQAYQWRRKIAQKNNATQGAERAHAANNMRKINNDLLPKVRKNLDTQTELWTKYDLVRLIADDRFKQERKIADPKALRALQQVKKQRRTRG